MKINITVLTLSSKHKNYCVAGIDNTGSLVRLISDDIESFGALSYKDLKYQNGQMLKIMDYICVDGEEKNDAIQPENFLINRTIPFTNIGKKSLQEALYQYSFSQKQEILGNRNCMLTVNKISQTSKSLEIITFTNGVIKKIEKDSGVPKYKLNFDYNNFNYENYSITDPNYYKVPHNYKIEHGFLVISLPNDDWTRAFHKLFKLLQKW